VTTSPPPAPPPGWYADPWRQRAYRWWDGVQWTGAGADHVDGLGPSVPPVPAAPAPVAAERPPSLPKKYVLPAVAVMVVSLVAEFALGRALFSLSVPPIVVIVGISFVLYGALVATARVVREQVGSPSWADAFGLAVKGKDVLYGLAVFVLGNVLGAVLVSPIATNPRYQGENTGAVQHFREDAWAIAGLILVAVVVAPIVEELFFRGVLLRALNDAIGSGPAVFAQAAFFGLCHYQPYAGTHNVEVVIAIFGAGLALGWSANHFRSLGPGMIAHAMRNLVAVGVALAMR